MCAIKIDMRAGSSEAIGAFRFEGQCLSVREQCLGPRLDLLAQRIFGSASGAVAGLRAIPADQAQANLAVQTLQFKRIAIYGDHIPYRRADAPRA